MNIIEKALGDGRLALSEYEAKQVLSAYGIPVTREVLVEKEADLTDALRQVGYPVVMKGCAAAIAHKTEKGLIHVDVRSEAEARQAFSTLREALAETGGAVLVQAFIRGQRELVVGMTRDPQFGPCVMFGLGGIFTEILRDVSFRKAPLERADALEMMQEIKGHKILGALRGMPAVDLETMAEILIRVGRIGLENDRVKEIDINPLIIAQGKPIAVDALIVLEPAP
jgi:acetyl-CoA synthetase (ADP-forming)